MKGWFRKKLPSVGHEFPSGVEALPDVGRIQGAQLQPSPVEAERLVILQYTDHKGKWFEVKMPFLDAMYLLNLLRQIETDTGYAPLNKPPSE
jgi:hypothetical protein